LPVCFGAVPFFNRHQQLHTRILAPYAFVFALVDASRLDCRPAVESILRSENA